MYCSRYKKECEEALYLSCDVPTSSNYINEEIKQCQDCVFCERNRDE